MSHAPEKPMVLSVGAAPEQQAQPARCALAAGSAIQDFRKEVIGQFVDYFPKPGETCEYQREAGEWILCEIIREYRREPTQYLARYVSHTGQLKTGIVGACNLRPSSPNK